jgi:phosphoribosylglycinamide formyltransferase-1
MKKIAILTSGKSRGSNFLAICDYIQARDVKVKISYVAVTDVYSPIVTLARSMRIPVKHLQSDIDLLDIIKDDIARKRTDIIALCGYMRKLPSSFLCQCPCPIVNIHPSLLPKYGGKGMYGMHVHRAVFEAGEKFSGATVHYVNEHYDDGEIIYQKSCNVSKCKTPEEIAEKVLKIEHKIYPQTICQLL